MSWPGLGAYYASALAPDRGEGSQGPPEPGPGGCHGLAWVPTTHRPWLQTGARGHRVLPNLALVDVMAWPGCLLRIGLGSRQGRGVTGSSRTWPWWMSWPGLGAYYASALAPDRGEGSQGPPEPG